jgi:hypothetical protein
MPQNGEINLKEVKAHYSVNDITLVDSREVDFANEIRLYYEVGFGIGLMLTGVLLGNLEQFDWYIFCTATIFLGFGIFNLIRYILKNRKIKIYISSDGNDLDKKLDALLKGEDNM